MSRTATPMKQAKEDGSTATDAGTMEAATHDKQLEEEGADAATELMDTVILPRRVQASRQRERRNDKERRRASWKTGQFRIPCVSVTAAHINGIQEDRQGE